MPEYALWTLVVSLIIYSLGVTYKLTSASFGLKLRDKEIDSLVKQLAFIKNHQEKAISSLSELNHAELPKILDEYRDQINNLNKIVLDMKTPNNYTAYLKSGGKMTIGLVRAIAKGDVVLKKET